MPSRSSFIDFGAGRAKKPAVSGKREGKQSEKQNKWKKQNKEKSQKRKKEEKEEKEIKLILIFDI